jgi:hypothetical protein
MYKYWDSQKAEEKQIYIFYYYFATELTFTSVNLPVCSWVSGPALASFLEACSLPPPKLQRTRQTCQPDLYIVFYHFLLQNNPELTI